MVRLQQLLFTSGILVVLAGGITIPVKAAIRAVEQNIRELTEACRVQAVFDDNIRKMNETDSIILEAISVKEELINDYLEGRLSFQETAIYFRKADEQIPDQIRNALVKSDYFYPRQVASWALNVARRNPQRFSQSLFQKIRTDIEYLPGDIRSSLANVIGS